MIPTMPCPACGSTDTPSSDSFTQCLACNLLLDDPLWQRLSRASALLVAVESIGAFKVCAVSVGGWMAYTRYPKTAFGDTPVDALIALTARLTDS